jgi:SAM-dependent methyltransferase
MPASPAEPASRVANADQRAYWTDRASQVWIARQELLDEQLAPLGARTLDALAPQPGERVLDVGCGCGASTAELARRVGAAGRAVGIDIALPLLAHGNVVRAGAAVPPRFLAGDAQTPPLAEGSFDAWTSRFGVMFFAEPERAFAALVRLLRPGGRVAFVCWQEPALNPWMIGPAQAAAPYLELPPPPPPGSPGPFTLADPDRVQALLRVSGLVETRLDDARMQVHPGGGNLDEATRLAFEIGPLGAALRERPPDEAGRRQVEQAVRECFEAQRGSDGRVAMSGAAWVVTAHRAD